MRSFESQIFPTIRMNTELLEAVAIAPTRPSRRKPTHVDPRPVSKRQGFGKGNWGSINEVIDDGVKQFYREKIWCIHLLDEESLFE